MTINRNLLFLITLLVSSANVGAETDESFVNYDSIINELKLESPTTVRPAEVQSNEWDDVAIHGNIGLGTSLVSVVSPGGASGSGVLKGIHLGFGVNLFTTFARAEGVFTSYGSEPLSRRMRADLKEFELRLILLPDLGRKILLRMGAGLSARYMDLKVTGEPDITASTPSSLFLLGIEHKLSKNVSVGPDLSYRSALISDTFDKSAWDGVLRLNATF